MRTSRRGFVTVEVDGVRYSAKYIGKGSFSKVYRIGDRVVYYTGGDCAKEVLDLYQYDKMTHLPDMIRHEDVRSRYTKRYMVFSAPYYRNVRASDTSAWRLMKFIISEFYKFKSEYNRYQLQAYGRVKEGEKYMLAFIQHLEETRVPRSVIHALYHLYELARNCGDRIGFDFKKDNFGVNEYGTLIFRDVIWVWG